MKKFILMFVLGSMMLWAVVLRFERSDQGIVTDNMTTLQWQDDYSDHSDAVPYLKWEPAINYCETLTLGGHDDWRLPNIKELQSLFDFDSSGNPKVSSEFRQILSSTNENKSPYWSSTFGYASDYEGSWAVDFGSLDSFTELKDYEGYDENYVICVRAGE